MKDLPNCTFRKYEDGSYVLHGPHHEIADFCQGVDGYWYVWFYSHPESFSIGAFNEHFFYWCYEKLKELNKPMDDSVNEYFKENN